MGLLQKWAHYKKQKTAQALDRYGTTLSNKRTVKDQRWEAIEALRSFKSPEAVAQLLRRFDLVLDHAIQDASEKQACFEAIVAWGNEALPAVLEAVRLGRHVAWPLKILERLLSREEYVQRLMEVLEGDFVSFDERAQERHTEALLALKELAEPGVFSKVSQFVSSRDEGVRMAAVECLEAIAAKSMDAQKFLVSLAAEPVTDDNSRFLGVVHSILRRQGWAVGNPQAEGSP